MLTNNAKVLQTNSLLESYDVFQQGLTLYDGSDVSQYSGYYYVNVHSFYKLKTLMKTPADATYVGTNKTTPIRGVVFGTGTTAPTENDYKLSGDAIAGLSNSNITMNEEATYDDSGAAITVVYTISNTTGAEITIGEVGLLDTLKTKESSVYAEKYHTILWERTVLGSPVTIPAGGVGQVTYTIRMNYPT